MKSLRSNRVSFLGCFLIGLLTVVAGNMSAQTTPPGQPPTTPQAPLAKIISPTNSETFSGPADIPITAGVSDVGAYVMWVAFYSGSNQLALRHLDPLPGATNGTVIPVLFDWTNVPAGTYTLTVRVTNTVGMDATSAPVTIVVGPISNSIPVVTIAATDPAASAVTGDPGKFTLYRSGNTNNSLNVFYAIGGTASNGVDYATLSNTVTIPAGVTSVDVTVAPVIDPNPDPDESVILHLAPSPLLTPVNYIIGSPDTAEVIIAGNFSNHPPSVEIVSPADGAAFSAPANIPIIAHAFDPDGSETVQTVEFFEGTNSLGITTNRPVANPIGPFFLVWTNVPPGSYTLTAVATDIHGATGTSGPVHVFVGSVTNIPVVNIFAPDPIAVEGTNFFCFRPMTAFSNFICGTNTATFLVHRTGDTNSDLTVYYNISGTASNGVDYAQISNNVTIPAGKRFSLITIVPMEDIDPSLSRFSTVILALKEPPTVTPTNPPPPYLIGCPAKAAAIILEDFDLPRPRPWFLRDHCFDVGLPGIDGQTFCIQVSPDMINWTPICTNAVLKGCIHFIDPDACLSDTRYYRAVPMAAGITPLFY